MQAMSHIETLTNTYWKHNRQAVHWQKQIAFLRKTPNVICKKIKFYDVKLWCLV